MYFAMLIPVLRLFGFSFRVEEFDLGLVFEIRVCFFTEISLIMKHSFLLHTNIKKSKLT